MKILLKTGVLSLLVFCFPACILQNGMEIGLYEGQKDACGFAVSQYTGNGLRWDTSKFPISFYIHESVPLEAHKNFISATEHWNIAWEEFLLDQGVEPFLLFSIVDKNSQYSGSPGNDTYNVLFFITDKFSNYVTKTSSTSGKSNIQAVTAMMSSPGGDIKDTDIIVNNENFRYFYDENYDEDILLSKKEIANNRRVASSMSEGFWFRFKQQIQAWFNFLLKPFKKKKALRQIAKKSSRVPRDRVDFPSLMVHELGHVPGLAHVEKSDSNHASNKFASKGSRHSEKKDISSVMEPKLLSGRSRRSIQDYDLNNLFCGYFDYD